jgi:hypothetical protein
MNSTSPAARKSVAIRPILAGGIAAGAMDLAAAYVIFGWRVPWRIARGLVGAPAEQGGVALYILGIALHFFIATSAAAVYYAASRKLRFLRESFIVCGMSYGVGVYLVMNLIVLPLSAYHSSAPIPRGAMVQGMLVHMFCVGLPIAIGVRRYSD